MKNRIGIVGGDGSGYHYGEAAVARRRALAAVALAVAARVAVDRVTAARDRALAAVTRARGREAAAARRWAARLGSYHRSVIDHGAGSLAAALARGALAREAAGREAAAGRVGDAIQRATDRAFAVTGAAAALAVAVDRSRAAWAAVAWQENADRIGGSV